MIVFIAIASLMVSASLAAFEPNDVCKLLPDNTRIRDLDSCENYYICQNGVANLRSCDNNFQYNKDKETCTTKSLSTCGIVNDEICQGKKGYWEADPASCDGFYYCSGSAAQKGHCPSGQEFVESRQACVHSTGSCTKGTANQDDINAICAIVPNGKYFGVASDCKSHAVCLNGQYKTDSCPSPLLFEGKDGSCGYESSCRQTLGTGVVPEDPSGNSDPPAVDGDCQESEKGKYKSDGTCTGFYWCSEYDMQWRRGVCANGRAFDSTLQKCVARSKKRCETYQCQDTEGRYQWVNDPTNCNNYYYCKDNKIAGKDKCAKGYFNVDDQRCVTGTPSSEYLACGEQTQSPPTGDDDDNNGGSDEDDDNNGQPPTGGDDDDNNGGDGGDDDNNPGNTGSDDDDDDSNPGNTGGDDDDDDSNPGNTGDDGDDQSQLNQELKSYHLYIQKV